jgi:uncharacterized membrane protein
MKTSRKFELECYVKTFLLVVALIATNVLLFALFTIAPQTNVEIDRAANLLIFVAVNAAVLISFASVLKSWIDILDNLEQIEKEDKA